MSDLRKAVEMALEASKKGCYEMAQMLLEAALRQALAESANSTTSVAESKALAQPKQEPMASDTYDMIDRFLRDNLDDDEYAKYLSALETIYTAPPKREWKGLTSDDKHFLLANAWNKEQAFDGFMDAIDKFLEEKNT